MHYVSACRTFLLGILLFGTASAQAGEYAIDAGGCRHWVSKIQAGSRIEWTGRCEAGFAEGRGVQRTYVQGQWASTFQGVLDHGKRTGTGVYTNRYGDRYEGSFAADGEFTGTGTYRYGPEGTTGGDVYTGSIRNGSFDGPGTYVTGSDGTRYEGQFVQRKFVHGRITYRPGTSAVESYDGDFAEGYEGTGTLLFASGARYQGQFRSGRYEGTGVLVVPGAYRYEGAFSANTFHGQGKMILDDGAVVQGTFADNRLAAGFTLSADQKWRAIVKDGSVTEVFDREGRPPPTRAKAEEGLGITGKILRLATIGFAIAAQRATSGFLDKDYNAKKARSDQYTSYAKMTGNTYRTLEVSDLARRKGQAWRCIVQDLDEIKESTHEKHISRNICSFQVWIIQRYVKNDDMEKEYDQIYPVAPNARAYIRKGLDMDLRELSDVCMEPPKRVGGIHRCPERLAED
ncbi:hypothetical protein V4C85_23970 [Ralstonia solanacearum]|uniref:MORN repeat-containing protein n=1 Tax=Ralstonia solanacearum TaxID=305 RepID=UPI000B04CE55|nr:hypothetical protein [Ralstonia solanacearum]